MKTLLYVLFVFAFLTSCGGTAENLKVNDLAPDFTLENAYGTKFSLSDYRDKSPVVLYFYPEANTSGCTKQACGVRDEYPAFQENGIVIFGISVDNKEEIKKFIDNYNLNFPLLSDSDKKVSKQYGVLNKLGFANRISFIIDKTGRIAEVIRDVNIETHAQQVLSAAKNLK